MISSQSMSMNSNPYLQFNKDDLVIIKNLNYLSYMDEDDFKANIGKVAKIEFTLLQDSSLQFQYHTHNKIMYWITLPVPIKDCNHKDPDTYMMVPEEYLELAFSV